MHTTGISLRHWILTCSAIFSLLEARGQLRWAVATSTSTVSVWVQSRVKRLGEVSRDARHRTDDGRGERDAFEKGPQGTQAHPYPLLTSPPTRFTGETGQGPGRELGSEGWPLGGRGRAVGPVLPSMSPNLVQKPSQDYQTLTNKGRGRLLPND